MVINLEEGWHTTEEEFEVEGKFGGGEVSGRSAHGDLGGERGGVVIETPPSSGRGSGGFLPEPGSCCWLGEWKDRSRI